LPALRSLARVRLSVGFALGAIATLFVLVGLAPATASGHAAFVESKPSAGARLEAGPAEISLAFTEPLNHELTEARLFDAESGAEIPAVLLTEGDDELILRPQGRLERAPYLVEWHTVSTVDGHALEGSFSFGVQTSAAATTQGLEQSPLARDGWLRIGARAVFYAALFFFAGGVLTTALLSGRALGGWLAPASLETKLQWTATKRQAVVRLAWKRTIDVGWLAVAAAIVVALAEASDAAGGLSNQGLTDFLLANGAGLARVGMVLALAVAVVLATRLPIAASAWLALTFLAIAYGGHANSADVRALAVVTDWVHLLAGATWVGGIAQVAATWLPLMRRGGKELGRAAAVAVLGRFGRLALPAFLVVLATGLTNAVIQLGHLEALWETGYGRVLAVKIGLVVLIAAASYGHVFRLRPALTAANPPPPPAAERRHWRLLGAEPWLGLGVIVAVAALVAFPLPPQQLGEADEAEAVAPCDPCPLAEARPDELAVAEGVGTRIAALWIRRDAGHLRGSLELLDFNARPVEAPVSMAQGELKDCGTGCWRFEAPLADALIVSVEEDGETYTAIVPAAWDGRGEGRARGLLRRAQDRMRALDALRLEEDTSSGPGRWIGIRYRFVAPDRMAYRTDLGGQAIAIGKTGYSRNPGGHWDKEPFGADGFQLIRFFRWTAYARTVRWLGKRTERGRPLVDLALFDPATPLWYRLTIDPHRALVISERMIAAGHFMDRRYFGFDRPLRIEAPR